jgi:4-hydroxybenzoate polyprenyltransferase
LVPEDAGPRLRGPAATARNSRKPEAMSVTASVPPLETPVAGVRGWLALLRPSQWSKNLFVLAALLFSGQATEPAVVLRALAAFAAFCLVASAVYAFNDVRDRDADRAHPTKRRRPVASGAIRPEHALAASAVLALTGVVVGAVVHVGVMLGLLAYLLLNLAYSLRLKHVVLLDVFCIAAFFVIRLLVGAEAVQVPPSVWLLLCGGLLALYLGFAKRRHELTILGDASAAHRGVLAHYSPQFLDQISAVLLAVTIVAYLMYTIESPTAELVGSDALSYGIPFVLYGVFRYLYLVHQRDQGSPTETVLSDRSLLVAVGLWVLYNGWVLYRPG